MCLKHSKNLQVLQFTMIIIQSICIEKSDQVRWPNGFVMNTNRTRAILFILKKMHSIRSTHKKKMQYTNNRKGRCNRTLNKMCECACARTAFVIRVQICNGGGMVQTICTHLNAQYKIRANWLQKQQNALNGVCLEWRKTNVIVCTHIT